MESGKKKKKKKWLLWTVGVVICLTAALMWILPKIFKNEIEAAICRKITEITEGTYTLRMKNFDLNLFTNSIEATEFELARDTAVFNKNGNSLGIDVYANRIKVSGLNFWKLIFNNTFQLNTIQIENGYARFNWNPNRKKQQNLKEKKGGLEHVILKNIDLKEMDLRFYNEKKQAAIYSGTANLDFRYLKIDRQGLPTVKSLEACFSESTFHFGDNDFKLDTTYFTYDHSALHVKMVNLVFSDESQHMMKIFPGSKVKYRFTSKEMSLVFKDLAQIEGLARNEMKFFSLSQVKMEEPELILYRDTLKQQDTALIVKKEFPLYIQKCRVKNGRFLLVDIKDNRTRLDCRGVDMNIEDLGPSPENYLVPVTAASIEIQNDSILYYHKNAIQITRMKNISLNTEDSLLKCDKLDIRVTIPEDQYFIQRQYQCDLPYVEINNITLNRIDADYLLKSKYLHAEQLHISSFLLRMIRDKNFPYQPGKIVEMPQEQIRNIETPVYIQKVWAQGGKIDYYEIPSNGNPRGNLWIDKVQLIVDNISNDSSVLAYNDTMKVTMEGYLYSSGLLQVFANMPLNDPEYRHYVYGRIGKLDPGNLNRITMNCAQMKIQKGMINGGEFEFFADKTESKGRLNLEFEKLKLKILTAGS